MQLKGNICIFTIQTNFNIRIVTESVKNAGEQLLPMAVVTSVSAWKNVLYGNCNCSGSQQLLLLVALIIVCCFAQFRLHPNLQSWPKPFAVARRRIWKRDPLCVRLQSFQFQNVTEYFFRKKAIYSIWLTFRIYEFWFCQEETKFSGQNWILSIFTSFLQYLGQNSITFSLVDSNFANILNTYI